MSAIHALRTPRLWTSRLSHTYAGRLSCGVATSSLGQGSATMAAAKTDVQNYKFNHTMLRVKDPARSIRFYEFLGMSVVKKLAFPESGFDLHFLAYDSARARSGGASVFDREGVLELTHNHGTEADAGYGVNNGNVEPHRGFGHVCVSVDDLRAACARIEQAGYRFQKRLTDGRMRHVAFALDPDGYWVEIIGRRDAGNGADDDGSGPVDVSATDPETYRMNHTMIRVKDAEKSLKFYRETLGMTLFRTSEQAGAGFNLYFLGYPGAQGAEEKASTADREGVLELTWNYGTEKDEAFKYHDGNAQPQGFGHICISVDDIEAACQRLDALNVSWKKRLTEGRMKNVAFVLDPDGYWIELMQNERFSGLPNF